MSIANNFLGERDDFVNTSCETLGKHLRLECLFVEFFTCSQFYQKSNKATFRLTQIIHLGKFLPSTQQNKVCNNELAVRISASLS